MKAADLAKLYRIEDGKDFRLDRIDPSDTCGLDIEKAEAKEQIAADIKEMKDLQEKLYAEGKWALLIVLQGIDDGVEAFRVFFVGRQNTGGHMIPRTEPGPSLVSL